MTPSQEKYNKQMNEEMKKQKKEEPSRLATPTEQKESLDGKTFVICSKCKKEKKCRKDVYQNRIVKFGSEEEMNKNYICRDCKKQTK